MFLMTLAPSSRASDTDARRAFPPSSSIDNLRSGSSGPESFQMYVDGSRAKQGDPEIPGVFGRREALASGADARPSRPQGGRRPGETSVPPPLSAGGRKSRLNLDLGTSDLPVRTLAAVLGLGFFLIAASMLETPVESAPEAEPLHEHPYIPIRRAARAPDPSAIRTRVESAPSQSPFIDTRMPVSTWRAISWREQRLIERWDSSREKSLGQASLSEWLGANASVADADVPLLLTKLRRDA